MVGEHTLILNGDWTPFSVMPFSATHWHRTISGVILGQLKPIHFYETWTVHSPTTTFRVPSVAVATTKFVHIQRNCSQRYSNAFLRDDYICQYCGQKANSPTADHVIPKSKKGSSRLDNIATACTRCNNNKGNNENIRPKKMPYMPTYYELVKKYRKLPINVPHLSWVEYIGWERELVVLVEPSGMPGYVKQ